MGQTQSQGTGLQPTGSFTSRLFGVQNYRNNAAIKKANALLSNPLFNPGPTGPKLNANKLGNFAKGLATNVMSSGKVPNNATMEKKTKEFASMLGFQQEAPQPPVKNLFGNPVNTTAPGYLGPAPGQQLFSFSRGGKRGCGNKKKTRRLRR
jgi:hypothetical protein